MKKTSLTYISVEVLSYTFSVLCILGTLGLAFNCFLKYKENDDISRTSYQKFHFGGKENVYPSTTLCFVDPFLDHELQKYGDGINASSYSKFLLGRHWDDRMLKVDFDNVTISLTDYLNGIFVQLMDQTSYLYNPKEGRQDLPEGLQFNFYVSYTSDNFKCFTFDVPYLENRLVLFIEMQIRNSIFSNGDRPIMKWSEDGDYPLEGFFVFFHYPGQFALDNLWYSTNGKYDWGPKLGNVSYRSMEFAFQQVEVIKRRNKPEKPCLDKWTAYDQHIHDEIMYESGCKPPHWNTVQNLNPCTSSKQMRNFTFFPVLNKVVSFIPPCRSIQSLDYKYYETEYITPYSLAGIEYY